MHKVFLGTAFSCCLLLAQTGCSAGVPIGAEGAAANAWAPVGAPAKPSPGLSQVAGTSALAVHLVDGPLATLAEVNVDVAQVQLIDRQGMAGVLVTHMKVIDLLKLQNGISETLATIDLSAGTYLGLRLVLGSRNTVTLADGSSHALKVPAGQQSGIKMSLGLELTGGDSHDVAIDFDVAESIHVVAAGQSGQYILRPVLRAIDQQASGSIGGVLTQADLSTPLAGATVYAESLDAQGQPQIVRQTQSGADGSYQLTLLPLGATYHVVVSPAGLSGTSYQGATSGDIPLDEGSPAAGYGAAVAAAGSTGSVRVQVSPMAGDQDGDTCQVLQGENGIPLIMASAATNADGQETASFTGLPVGSYTVRCMRRTTDASGATVATLSMPTTLTITDGMSAGAAISF
jgi:hypothetical protein